MLHLLGFWFGTTTKWHVCVQFLTDQYTYMLQLIKASLSPCFCSSISLNFSRLFFKTLFELCSMSVESTPAFSQCLYLSCTVQKLPGSKAVNSRAPDFQCFTNLGLVTQWSHAYRKPRAPSCTAFNVKFSLFKLI